MKTGSRPATILVVDDEPKIVQLVRQYLEHAGFRVIAADNGDTAIQRFYQDAPDLLVLDLMIPGMNGLDVARMVRRRGHTPIIMLTALVGEADRLAGLDIGADDYVVKPFSPRELTARVRAVLRRSGLSGESGRNDTGADDDSPPIVVGPLRIDPVRREIRCYDEPVVLTSYQFDLLVVLARDPGRVFSRTRLVEAVQGALYEGYERTMDAHIKNIRKALGDHAREPRFIETVRGVGYRFLEQPAERG